MNVYLCGSFRNNWQEKIMKGCPQHTYFNPKEFKEITNPKIYTALNLKGIELCDLVFSYLEADNPTPINITLETTYGYSLGKTIILCCEWEEGHHGWFKEVNAAQLKEISTHVTNSLEDAIKIIVEAEQ